MFDLNKDGTFTINRNSSTTKMLASHLNSNLLKHASLRKSADEEPINFVLGQPDVDKQFRMAADKIKSKHTLTRMALVV